MEKVKCIYCNKAIRKWTSNKYKDWNKRKAHKTCWKEEQLRKEFQREMDKWRKDEEFKKAIDRVNKKHDWKTYSGE